MAFCPIFRVYCDGYDPDYETCTLENYACPFTWEPATENDPEWEETFEYDEEV